MSRRRSSLCSSLSEADLLWIVHLTLVVMAAGFFVVAVVGHGDAPDANIGAGLAVLGLVALGAPWSLLVLDAGGGAVDGNTEAALLVAASLLNTVLLGALARGTRTLRRRARRS